MKKISILAIIFFKFLTLSVHAQQAKKQYPFYDDLKLNVEDSTSAFFYKKLLNKIKNNPDAVTQQELFFLYYGQVTIKKPHGMPFLTDGINDFIKAVIKHKNKLIVELGLKMLKDNPVDLTVLTHTVFAIQKTKQPDSLFLDKRLRMLFDIIFSTGDGKTKETPIKIADIQDSAIIKDVLKFKSDDEQILSVKGVPLTAWVKGDQKLYIENVWAYL